MSCIRLGNCVRIKSTNPLIDGCCGRVIFINTYPPDIVYIVQIGVNLKVAFSFDDLVMYHSLEVLYE